MYMCTCTRMYAHMNGRTRRCIYTHTRTHPCPFRHTCTLNPTPHTPLWSWWLYVLLLLVMRTQTPCRVGARLGAKGLDNFFFPRSDLFGVQGRKGQDFECPAPKRLFRARGGPPSFEHTVARAVPGRYQSERRQNLCLWLFVVPRVSRAREAWATPWNPFEKIGVVEGDTLPRLLSCSVSIVISFDPVGGVGAEKRVTNQYGC